MEGKKRRAAAPGQERQHAKAAPRHRGVAFFAWQDGVLFHFSDAGEAQKVYRILIMSKYSANEKNALRKAGLYMWQHPHVRGEDSVILLYFLSTSVVLPLFQNCRKPPEESPVSRPAQSHRRFPAFTAARCFPFLPLPSGRATPGIFPLWQTSGRATPSAPCAVAAMARARRRSRTPEGRTERRSRRGHHPAHGAGKVRADAPRATRRAGYSPTQETNFAFPHKGEYGGAGGVEGQPPLSPHAPRRAGDPPPTPGRSRDAQRDTGSIRPGRFTFFKVELL